jgi:hypothetical protein
MFGYISLGRGKKGARKLWSIYSLEYRLNNQGIMVQFPPRARHFSLLQCTQNDSRAHPASYSMVTRGPVALSLGLQQPRCEADRAPPSNDKDKNEWSYTTTAPCLHFMQTGLTFTFCRLKNDSSQ